jgi:hypothetical protein
MRRRDFLTALGGTALLAKLKQTLSSRDRLSVSCTKGRSRRLH